MVDLIVPGTDLKVSELEFDRYIQAIGGNLLIKELPYYPPIDCNQLGCYEFAEYAVAMLTADVEADSVCTLCQLHLNRLLDLHLKNVPVHVFH